MLCVGVRSWWAAPFCGLQRHCCSRDCQLSCINQSLHINHSSDPEIASLSLCHLVILRSHDEHNLIDLDFVTVFFFCCFYFIFLPLFAHLLHVSLHVSLMRLMFSNFLFSPTPEWHAKWLDGTHTHHTHSTPLQPSLLSHSICIQTARLSRLASELLIPLTRHALNSC